MTEFFHSLLTQIPEELQPWVALAIGAVVLVCLVLFHGMGIHNILKFHKRSELRLWKGRPHIGAAIFLFGASVFLMLSLHIIGVLVWAFILTHLGLIVRGADAIYFCANAYTTLGYGNVDIDTHFRNISPIIGISGLFTFAWTTSALVGVVTSHNRLLEQLEIEREKELELRGAARGAVGAVRDQEATAERAIRGKMRQMGGPRERLEEWREEHREIEVLRDAERDKIANIRDKEREDEEKLGPGMPSE